MSQPKLPPNLVLRSIESILKPAARFLIRNGVGFTAAAGALKQAYLDVVGEFALPGKPMTASRVALLTGIHRAQLRQRALQTDLPTGAPSIAARVVTEWTGNPVYLSAEGGPAPLARLRSAGGRRSFESLVESISKDIRPRALLDDWLDHGMVELDPEDKVTLLLGRASRTLPVDDIIATVTRHLHDHWSVVDANLARLPSSAVDRTSFSMRLSPQSVAELKQLALEEAKRTLDKMNLEITRREERDRVAGNATERFTVGVYCWSEPAEVNADRPAKR